MYVSSKSAQRASVAYFSGGYAVAISTPSDSTIDNQRPQIAAKLARSTQNEDIAMDLKTINGRPNDPTFDTFWVKADYLLEEYKRFDDRRHGALLR